MHDLKPEVIKWYTFCIEYNNLHSDCLVRVIFLHYMHHPWRIAAATLYIVHSTMLWTMHSEAHSTQ